MCGRYSLTTPEEAMRRLFAYTGPPCNLPARYNIAPTQPVPAVRVSEDGRARVLVMLRWGLIPPWAKDPSIGARMINARAETVAEKPSFRVAFAHRRCLIPASGFYEWARRNGARQPYNIRLRDDGPFAFAGLWERWRPRTGLRDGAIESCVILTTEADATVAPIHPRMPVILAPDDYAAWLDMAATPPGAARALLAHRRAVDLEAYPVSPRVNNVRNDDAECLAPIDVTNR